MENVILVIHLFLALSIIGLVLLQRSEGGGLGIGGGGGGLGGLASPESTGNILSKVTGFCAAAFFCTSLILGVLASQHSRSEDSLVEALGKAQSTIEAPLEKPEETPAVPVSE
ncbi:MAG: preprotein translocase subunit SecG [Alphaproteobacteria bacterium]